MSTPGTAQWALEKFGIPCNVNDMRNVFIFGHDLRIHKGAVRHFKRLDRIFANHSPRYYKLLCKSPDVFTYSCRDIAGTNTKSNHSWPIAIDLRSAANARNGQSATQSEMWKEARDSVLQAEKEGFRWGGRYTSPDPMHFETLLTPKQIRQRYFLDGTKKPWRREK